MGEEEEMRGRGEDEGKRREDGRRRGGEEEEMRGRGGDEG